MDLKEQVFKAFRSRIEAGENERKAVNFLFSDFPGFSKQDFCDMGYAKKIHAVSCFTTKRLRKPLKNSYSPPIV